MSSTPLMSTTRSSTPASIASDSAVRTSPTLLELNRPRSATRQPGRITSIVADQGTQQTFCSGAKARNGETWASTFYTTVDASGSEWQLSINVENFRGPGTYANRDVQISLQAPDNSRAWLNQGADASAHLAADKVTFTIDRSMQSGTIDAALTSAATGKRGAERIAGAWNCRG